MGAALPLRPAMRTTGSFQTMAASGPGTAVSVRAQRVVSCDRLINMTYDFSALAVFVWCVCVCMTCDDAPGLHFATAQNGGSMSHVRMWWSGILVFARRGEKNTTKLE